MALEATGNKPFDMLAARLEQRIQAGKPTSAVMLEDVLGAMAQRDDGQVSTREAAVISHLKGSIPAVGVPPAASAPPTAKPVAKPSGYSSATVSNFHTYFLNFAQLPEGKEFGESAISRGQVPHLNRERSNLFAQKLGFGDAKELQRHVGAYPDGLIGPKTIAKLNAQNDTKADAILKAPDQAALDQLAKGDRRGFTESTFKAVLGYRQSQLKPAT